MKAEIITAVGRTGLNRNKLYSWRNRSNWGGFVDAQKGKMGQLVFSWSQSVTSLVFHTLTIVSSYHFHSAIDIPQLAYLFFNIM